MNYKHGSDCSLLHFNHVRENSVLLLVIITGSTMAWPGESGIPCHLNAQALLSSGSTVRGGSSNYKGGNPLSLF